MSGGVRADEDGAGVPVVEHLGGVVQYAPARNHVEFVAVVLDVRDDAVGGGSG